MSSGIWTSVSGAAAQSQNVDTIANNLANSDTLGFKKDTPTFKEYLAAVEREKTMLDIPRGPFKDKDMYPLDGKDQSFVVVDGTHTNFRQGPIRVTQSPLDVALDGPGFFEVSTPNGIRYTRQGSFKMAMDGRLVTSEGYPVLSAQPGGLAASNRAPAEAAAVQPGQGRLDGAQGGASADPAIAARFINLRDVGSKGKLTITEEGEVYGGNDLVAKLSVVEFADLKKVTKATAGTALFESRDPSNHIPPAKTALRQGMIEGSNVNPLEEMTNLIKANRIFEQNLKAMKTYGEMMGREASDIGKL